MQELSNHFKKDWNERLNPTLLTSLLMDAVPSIKDVEFKYLKVEYGYCKSILPLNSNSSNQHGTHQALILGLAGDYTAGLAFASLILFEPILGVHEVTPDRGMSIWLIKSDMEYIRPSTDDVIVEAFVDKSLSETLTQNYHDGNSIFFEVDASFKNLKNQDVAKGRFKYYCKKKNALSRASNNKPISTMFEHILKTSAKLIAQLRAVEGDKQNALFKDEISRKVAGKQGKVIADRFLEVLPELQNMIASRTMHLNNCLLKYQSTIKNIVFIGVGLDFRIYNNDYMKDEMNVYELDLKEMITERQELELILGLNNRFKNEPIKICCNFLIDSISEKLKESGFDPSLPTFYIYEGCSMYFNEEENTKILSEIAALLLKNNESLLWMDSVSEMALGNESNSISVKSFLSNMAKLGEPFIYGFNVDFSLLRKLNLSVIETNTTTDIMPGEVGDIYKLYHFNLINSR